MNSYNTINYLNLLAACINIVLFTLDSNEDYGPDYDFFNRFNLRDLSRRYINGAMTPAEPFFVIFNIVSLFLSVFAMIQFLPAYRSLSMVQDGVGYWYFIGTVAQIFAFTFSVDNIEVSFVTSLLSTIFFSITCASTWKILHNQHHNATSDNSPEEYWLIRFPFQLQSGWNIALTTMSVNILFRGDINGGFSAVMNSILIIASLIVYAAISGKLLFFSGNVTPNYVIPSVIALVTVSRFAKYKHILYTHHLSLMIILSFCCLFYYLLQQ